MGYALAATRVQFCRAARVTARDGFAELKSTGRAYLRPDHYEDIAVPRNTPIGMIYMIALTILSMALTWYIWWLVVLSAAVLPLALIVRSFFIDQERVIPATEVEREHRAWLDAIGQAQGITRDRETTSDNLGLAALEPAP